MRKTETMAGSAYSDERTRLLECWLPLAQEANRLYGWGYDAAALERLIIRAASQLNHAHTPLEARGILWHQQRLLRNGGHHADDPAHSTKKP